MSETDLISREGKRSPRQKVFRRRQTALWCGCVSSHIRKSGLCAACYARRQHDRRFFAGHRAAVVARDGRVCRLCSAACLGPSTLVVHHRRPGRSRLLWLVTLCRACHARVHRLELVRRVYSGPFLEMWREQHPAATEQLALSFDLHPDPPASRSLFEGSDG